MSSWYIWLRKGKPLQIPYLYFFSVYFKTPKQVCFYAMLFFLIKVFFLEHLKKIRKKKPEGPICFSEHWEAIWKHFLHMWVWWADCGACIHPAGFCRLWECKSLARTHWVTLINTVQTSHSQSMSLPKETETLNSSRMKSLVIKKKKEKRNW